MIPLAVLLCAAAATWGGAQEYRHPQLDAQACRDAARSVETGRPPRGGLARDIIRECGGVIAGNAAASATMALRLERDTSVLADGASPFWGLQDTAFYRAASHVSRDRSSSPEARASAIRSLVGMLYQGGFAMSYESLMTEGADCDMTMHTGLLPLNGTGLPPDAEARTGALLTGIVADAGEPATVRRAAACALRLVRAGSSRGAGIRD